MIYVYWGYEVADEDDSPIKVIKIGYTDNWEVRLNAHRTSRPKLRVLFTVDGGTQEDEYSIQSYFRDYQFPCGSTEWFYYREEIINFFREHTTIEEIMKVVPRVSSKKGSLPDRVVKFISSFITGDTGADIESYKYLKRLISKRKLKDLDSLRIFLEAEGYPEESINRALTELNNQVSLSENATKFLEDYIENPSVNFKKLLKCFCEAKESVRNEVIYYIPYSLRYFYTTLGPERCRSLGYDRMLIKRDLNIKGIDQDLVKSKIYSAFTEGEKISRPETKSKLEELYKEIGYKKTPKATDLEEWFELRECTLTVDGKKTRGFELIKKKQNSSGEA